MGSKSIIMVPPRLLPLLRSGAQVQAGRAAEAFSYASERFGRERHSEWFLEPRRLMDDYTELLDVVGWAERRPERDIAVNTDYHGDALASALEGQLEMERYQRVGGTRPGRRRARRNARRIRRFLAANDLAPRPPLGVRVGLWMREFGDVLVACARRSETPLDCRRVLAGREL